MRQQKFRDGPQSDRTVSVLRTHDDRVVPVTRLRHRRCPAPLVHSFGRHLMITKVRGRTPRRRAAGSRSPRSPRSPMSRSRSAPPPSPAATPIATPARRSSRAIEDYQSGRLSILPPDQRAPATRVGPASTTLGGELWSQRAATPHHNQGANNRPDEARIESGHVEMPSLPSPWPALPYDAWHATCDTLHAHTQVLGKLAAALAPPEPQLQHAALRLSAPVGRPSPFRYPTAPAPSSPPSTSAHTMPSSSTPTAEPAVRRSDRTAQSPTSPETSSTR